MLIRSRLANSMALGCLLLLLSAATAAGAGDPVELGRMFLEEDGVLEPSWRVIASGVVRTQTSPAIVHLDNGEVLRFDANSSAVMHAEPGGEVRLTVLSGEVAKWSPKGKLLRAGSGSFVVVAPSNDDPLAVEARLIEAANRPGTGRRPVRRSQTAR